MPRLPKCTRIDDLLLFVISFTFEIERQNRNLRSIKQKLPGWWSEMKGIVGGTRFTKLGLTISNTIGRFSGGSLGYD